MFSNYTLEIYSSSSYNYYNTVNDELETVKGQIDFNKYVNNYAVGNRQKLSCVYDSLQYDNQFNRIVKYVCILLKDFTKNIDSKRNLEDILFILDEVDNIAVTAEDCDKVVLNSIYSEYRIILDNCKMFLTSLSIYKWKDDYSVFALLIPSEKLFENFIFTTFKRNIREPIKNVSKTRPGRNYLVKKTPSEVPNKFKLINDFIIELLDNTHIIFDTKYKKLISKDGEEDDSFDADYNVSQTDIYQMVSYAVASGISDIALIYPVLPFEKQTKELSIYEIEDSFTNGTIIRVHLFIVDIIHENVLELNINEKLENIFESSNQRLINQLNQAVNKINSI
jgi:5-methylcytosine-specific restriction enzyme subunit McrC